MSKIITYFKNGDGWVLGQHFADGEPIALRPEQARYMLAPLGTELRTQATIKPKREPKAE